MTYAITRPHLTTLSIGCYSGPFQPNWRTDDEENLYLKSNDQSTGARNRKLTVCALYSCGSFRDCRMPSLYLHWRLGGLALFHFWRSHTTLCCTPSSVAIFTIHQLQDHLRRQPADYPSYGLRHRLYNRPCLKCTVTARCRWSQHTAIMPK